MKKKPRNFRSRKFMPVATAIGQMTLAWNDLHQILATLFWVATGIPNALVPFAIWNSSKADRAQRGMLEAMAKLNALGHDMPKEIRKEILWLLTEADKLEELRNNAIHSPMIEISASGPGITAHHHLGHKRAKSWIDKDIHREIRWFYDATTTLREYAHEITLALCDKSETLPKRPRLPNRGTSKNRHPATKIRQ